MIIEHTRFGSDFIELKDNIFESEQDAEGAEAIVKMARKLRVFVPTNNDLAYDIAEFLFKNYCFVEKL